MRTFQKQQKTGSQATSSVATSEGALSPGLSPPTAGAPGMDPTQHAAGPHPPSAAGALSGYPLEGAQPTGSSPTPRSSLTAALKGSSPVQASTPTFQVERVGLGVGPVPIPGKTTVGFSVEAPGFVPAAAQKPSQNSSPAAPAISSATGPSVWFPHQRVPLVHLIVGSAHFSQH